MNHFYSNLKLFLFAVLAGVGVSAWGDEVTDVLNQSVTGVTGTSYTDFSGKTATSMAVYAGQCAGDKSSIQLRSNNSNSGVISTTSGGKLKKVVVTWNGSTNGARELNIYGSNTAYSAATDLYNASTQGTLLGTLKCEDATEGVSTLDVDGDYTFIGFRSKSGAMYLTSVEITWVTGSVPPSVAKPTLPASTSFVASMEVAISAAEGAKIYYTLDGTDPTTESFVYTEALTITETTTVKAIAVLNELTSAVAVATYTALTKSTIAEAQAAEVGTTVYVEGVIVASAANGAVLYDGTDYLYYYNTSNALTVGQNVRMVGALASYGGAKQLTNAATVTVLGTEEVTHPAAVALDGAAFDAVKTAGVATRQFVTFKGTLAISGNYYNVTIDGAAEAMGSIVKPSEDLSALDGKKVVVTGYLMYVNNKYVYVVATSVKEKPVIVNADFSSTEGWTAVKSTQYFDLGNGLIGTYKVRSEMSAATVDETHLATEYCFGFECRWQTNYAAYTQTTDKMKAGAYILSYDVENVNDNTTSAAYENRFSVTVGETVYSDNSTEWMNAKSAWTTHAVPFLLDADGTATISLGYGTGSNNFGLANTPALYVSHLKLTGISLEEYWKALLLEEINAAKAIDVTTNVGTAAFQHPASLATALTTALTTAEGVYNNSEATVEAIKGAITDLQAAEATFTGAELNAPAEGQLFNVALASGEWTYKKNNVTYTLNEEAMTYLANDRGDAGLYNIQYKEVANSNLAQAFTFTKVEGNNYKMSQIDADGNVRYICTGVPYGGNTAQIRTTTDVDQALVVTVIPTATEGKWNLRNTEANQYIGAQDAGVYTVNSHIDFSIVETTKATVAINTTEAGWGTVMLPFAVAALPEGVKAYTCAAVDGTTLTLAEVTALAANKPYIIEGAWNETLSGAAQGIQTTYTEGLLTGVYTETPAENGTYILQNHAGEVAFYLVNNSVLEKVPNVPANHAYLTVAGGVKAFYLGEATAIEKVMAGAAAGEIYDLAGRKVSRMVKGNAYIIGGRKVVVK